MLERTRLNYARVMFVPKSGSLVLGASPIAAVGLDRLPSRSVYWYFVRRDGRPSSSGIAARIWQQSGRSDHQGKIVARSLLR
jgi:hypothetical protein